MAGEEVIGKGKIEVSADLKPFDAAMATLPKKAASKMDEAMKSLQAKAAQVKLDLKLAYNSGNLEAQQRLIPVYENLRAKIAAVEGAAIRQAQAIRTVAAASQQAASAAQAQAAAQQRAAANGSAFNSMWLDQQVVGKLNQVGAAGKKAGSDVREGVGNGAMGLMLLAQTIDDAQFGFKAIVNNIPQVALAVGTAMGASTEAALKFGGAMGIAAVAINTWINNWEEAKAIFSGSESEDMKEVTDQMTRMGNAARSLFATLANLDRGWNWVSTTGEEAAAVAKQMEDREAFAKQHAKDVKARRNAVSGMTGDADEKRGKQFKDAVGAYGGGDKLANSIVGSRMQMFASLTGKARDAKEQQVRESVDVDIVAAKSGDVQALRRLAGEDSRLKALLPKYASGAKEARQRREHETKANVARTAGDLMDSVGRDILKNPKMGNSELVGKVKEAMEKAGYSVKEIVDLLPGVVEKIQADVNNKVRDRSGRDNIDADTARKQLLVEAAESDKRKRESTPQYREAERLAGAMDAGLGRRLLSESGMSDAELERNVKKSMKSAGVEQSKIDASASLVAQVLRKKVEEQVQGRALDKNITEGQARTELMKEAVERANKDQPKAEVLSTESYQSKLLVGALNKATTDVPKDQLNEQKTTNKKLDNMIKILAKPKPGTFAVAAPGR